MGVPQVVPARASPHLQHPHRVSGLMLANHTAVRHTLDKTVSQFDTLFQRKVTPHRTGLLHLFVYVRLQSFSAVLGCQARLAEAACNTHIGIYTL